MIDFGYTVMQSRVCINMILMACGRGRTASEGWENYAVDEYRHLTALFLKYCNIHLKFLPVQRNIL
jgi:hypothetical protein